MKLCSSELLNRLSSAAVNGSTVLLSSAVVNCLIDSASRKVFSNLFHSLKQKGKKECLKLSVPQENSCKLFLFAELVW